MDAASSSLTSGPGIWTAVALALASVSLAGLVLLFARQQRTKRQYRHWMTGTSGANLEALLADHVLQVRDTAARVNVLAQDVRRSEQALQRCVQHAAIVRYNPFRETGGDQSFSLALADALGNGIVLSGLHARDGTRVYGKPLLGWESAYALTDEEKEAITRARRGSRGS